MNKICTDIEQSKKLAEMLPIESADMTYRPIMDIDSMSNSGFLNIPECYPFNEFKDCTIKPLPCWSLAALLEQLDDEITDENGNDYNLTIIKEDLQYQLYYHDSWGQVEDIETDYYDDLVDACYEMIVLLKENNLL